jgi:hypothetical protein
VRHEVAEPHVARHRDARGARGDLDEAERALAPQPLERPAAHPVAVDRAAELLRERHQHGERQVIEDAARAPLADREPVDARQPRRDHAGARREQARRVGLGRVGARTQR